MIESLLAKKKTAIVDHWRRLVIETYPADAVPFLREQKDRFQNPVGHAISQETEALFDELIDGMNAQEVWASLENIIKIRSVQDFCPSRAVGFVYLLKTVIREQLRNELDRDSLARELLDFEARIDRLALMAFDCYADCRERLAEARVNDAKRQSYGLVDRLNALHSRKSGLKDTKDENS